jgi:hypothetical protein
MPMPTGPEQEVVDVTRSPGELAFEARLHGVEPQRVWFRSETEVVPSADAVLAACLMPAMRHGGRLTIDEPLSPRVLRRQRDYQAIQKAWSHGWDYGEEPLREVLVEAPERVPATTPRTGRVASFFSGGVDSFAAILDNPDITDLIFVRGVDLLPRLAHQDGLADEVEASLREASAQLGKPLHVVETNVRELSDPLIRWEPFFACPLVAIAHFFAPLFDRVVIAGDTDHETQPLMGAALLVDELWSSEAVEIADWGGRLNREQRVVAIAGHPVVQGTLRTCWENLGGAYNCGRCRKCLLTMVSLEAIGAREGVTTFPAELDLGVLDGAELTQPIALALWEDLLDHVRDCGRTDLAPPDDGPGPDLPDPTEPARAAREGHRRQAGGDRSRAGGNRGRARGGAGVPLVAADRAAAALRRTPAGTPGSLSPQRRQTTAPWSASTRSCHGRRRRSRGM